VNKAADRVIKGVSMPKQVEDTARQQMEKRRIRTFSNYIEILICEDAGRSNTQEEAAA